MREGAGRTAGEEKCSSRGQRHILNAVLSAVHKRMLQKMIVNDAVLIPPSCVYKDKYRQLKMRSQGIPDNWNSSSLREQTRKRISAPMWSS